MKTNTIPTSSAITSKFDTELKNLLSKDILAYKLKLKLSGLQTSVVAAKAA